MLPSAAVRRAAQVQLSPWLGSLLRFGVGREREAGQDGFFK